MSSGIEQWGGAPHGSFGLSHAPHASSRYLPSAGERRRAPHKRELRRRDKENGQEEGERCGTSRNWSVWDVAGCRVARHPFGMGHQGPAWLGTVGKPTESLCHVRRLMRTGRGKPAGGEPPYKPHTPQNNPPYQPNPTQPIPTQPPPPPHPHTLPPHPTRTRRRGEPAGGRPRRPQPHGRGPQRAQRRREHAGWRR